MRGRTPSLGMERKLCELTACFRGSEEDEGEHQTFLLSLTERFGMTGEPQKNSELQTHWNRRDYRPPLGWNKAGWGGRPIFLSEVPPGSAGAGWERAGRKPASNMVKGQTDRRGTSLDKAEPRRDTPTNWDSTWSVGSAPPNCGCLHRSPDTEGAPWFSLCSQCQSGQQT